MAWAARFRGHTIAELLRAVVFESNDYRPEALEALKRELSSRAGALEDIIRDHREQTGDVVALVEAQAGERGTNRYDFNGDLVLTTNGLGFIAREKHVDSMTMAAYAGNGIAGFLAQALDRLGAPAFADTSRDLSVSFLAAVFPTVSWFPKSNIHELTLTGRSVQVVPVEGKGLSALVAGFGVSGIKEWALANGIAAREKQPVGLVGAIKNLFGSKSAPK